jgi:LacI family transcriptional regulator
MGNTVANLHFQEKGNTDTTSKPKIISIKPELIIR